MKTKFRNKYTDITRSKTVTINQLKNDVKVATTTKSRATASYDSFVSKQQMFAELLTLSQADYNTKKANWDLLLTLKSSLISLKDTADSTNEVAQISDEQVKTMIEKWQKVTDETIRAADAINLTSSYIVQRKAANQLLSSDLVNDATKAAKAADSAVTLVITALTNALSSLGASNQANNSTLLTVNDINLAISMIIDPSKMRNEKSESLMDTGVSFSPFRSEHVPLERSLQLSLTKSKSYYDQMVITVDDVNNEVAKAKEEMDQATGELATLEAALKAAEAAVSG